MAIEHVTKEHSNVKIKEIVLLSDFKRLQLRLIVKKPIIYPLAC